MSRINERSAKYIEREIQYMSKDPYGGSSYAPYGDRVVGEITGIDALCTKVMASNNRGINIINESSKGSRGNAMIRLFNVSFHDARLDLVEIAAEIDDLRNKKDKESRKAAAYLTKVYRKAIDRLAKIINNGSTKKFYKDFYKDLYSFAKNKEIDYDEEYEEDDDDETDDELDTSVLTPPKIKKSSFLETLGLEPPKTVAEMHEIIAKIEAGLGRKLTDTEVEAIFMDDDEDDDFDEDDSEDTPVINGDFVKAIAEEVAKKIGSPTKSVNSDDEESHFETLDEFLEKNPPEANTEDSKSIKEVEEDDDEDDPFVDPVVEIIPESDKSETIVPTDNASVEELIDYHNGVKASPRPSDSFDALAISVKENESHKKKEEKEDSEADGESDTVEIPAGNVTPAGDTTNNKDIPLDPKILDPLFDEYDKRIKKIFDDSIKDDGIGCELHDSIISLSPSESEEHIINIDARLRYTGAFDTFNERPVLNTIYALREEISDLLNIPKDKIWINYKNSFGRETLESDFKALLRNKGAEFAGVDLSREYVTGIYNMAALFVAYTYNKFNFRIYAGIVNDPIKQEVKFLTCNVGPCKRIIELNREWRKLTQDMQNTLNANIGSNIKLSMTNILTLDNFSAFYKKLLQFAYPLVTMEVKDNDFIDGLHKEVEEDILDEAYYFTYPDDEGKLQPKIVEQNYNTEIINTYNDLNVITEHHYKTDLPLTNDDIVDLKGEICGFVQYHSRELERLRALTSLVHVTTKVIYDGSNEPLKEEEKVEESKESVKEESSDESIKG